MHVVLHHHEVAGRVDDDERHVLVEQGLDRLDGLLRLGARGVVAHGLELTQQSVHLFAGVAGGVGRRLAEQGLRERAVGVLVRDRRRRLREVEVVVDVLPASEVGDVVDALDGHVETDRFELGLQLDGSLLGSRVGRTRRS